MATIGDLLTAVQNAVVAANNISRQISNLQLGSLPVTTVAQLPAAASSKGKLFMVSDALAPAWNATVAGSGAVSVVVTSNGTNWVVV